MFDQIEALFALTDRWTRWQASRGSSSEESVAGRFLRLFETHGVHRNQIPRFFGHGLTLKHGQAESALIEQLESYGAVTAGVVTAPSACRRVKPVGVGVVIEVVVGSSITMATTTTREGAGGRFSPSRG
jgi:hypothetical protein